MEDGRSNNQSLTALLGIRELIFSGQLKPGDRLSEPALVKRLGVSRTPVRTALNRLELEGLVSTIPSGGPTLLSCAARWKVWQLGLPQNAALSPHV